MYTPKLSSRLAVEALGTFWLVFIGCGAAIFSANFPIRSLSQPVPLQLGIGFLGIGIAFGLAVTTMSYAVGHVSGAHFNPAVTIGIAVAKRFEWREVLPYLAAQVVGGLVAGAALAGLAGADSVASGPAAAAGAGSAHQSASTSSVGTSSVGTSSTTCAARRAHGASRRGHIDRERALRSGLHMAGSPCPLRRDAAGGARE